VRSVLADPRHGSAVSNWLRRISRTSILDRVLFESRAWYEETRWHRAGRPAPPPHRFKRRIVKAYAERYRTRVLIETGTYTGAMVLSLRHQFHRIVSIEVDPSLHARAAQRVRRWPNIELLLGDSEVVLPRVLASLQEPALFWLDGHYSGGITSRGRLNTPVVHELESVLSHPVASHVILIDDAREFTGQGDYPTLAAVRALALSHRPHSTVAVQDDVIRIHPS
jgi:hypothetical protein